MVLGVITVVAPITEVDAPSCDLDIRAMPEGYPNIITYWVEDVLTINVDDSFNPGLLLDNFPNAVAVDTSDTSIDFDEVVAFQLLIYKTVD